MRGGAEFAEVDLRGAKVGGQLDMTGSKFTGKLVMDQLEVGSSLLMGGAEVTTSTPLSLFFSEIGEILDISGSTLPSLDLTGTRIHGEFRLGSSEHSPTKWQKYSKLTLRNTKTEALQDSPKSWPEDLELDGFTYTRLGGFGADASNNMATRDTDWLEGWLEKYNGDSPQPYQQLAKVLRQMGHEDKAADVLYASRERERGEATGFKKVWLTSLKYAIGYGYGYHIWTAARRAVNMVMLGVLVLLISNQGPATGGRPSTYYKRSLYVLDISFYSLYMLLPIIRLDKRYHEMVFTDGVRYYFYIHQLAGYVLALFLIAGLTGLTK